MTYVVMKQFGIATTVFPDVELVSPHGTSSPSCEPAGGSGGHVFGLARLYNDLMLVLFVLARGLPTSSSSFRRLTLCTGSSVMRESQKLESPKKYVPRPEIVPAASIAEVSTLLMLTPQTGLDDIAYHKRHPRP